LTARLIDKLRSNSQNKSPSRFLAIVGASGSGKSSLTRAGLVAALKKGAVEGSDQWPVVICRPGSDPIANLAIELARKAGLELDKQTAFMDRCKDRMPQDRAALHESVQLILPPNDPDRRLVILVDQFEELFTICRDEKLRTAFVENLVHASQVPQGHTLVLLAMRADFYGKCATYSNLANALSERQQLIGPMTREELQQAIEKPAQKVGCELEPGLVDLLLNDVVNDPGSLPFLQFALKELWNRRTGGRKLTTEAYRGIGGVTGALQRKADEVYSHLSEPQQRICRRIFLRLTQPGEGTEDTKRRVSISELKPEAGSVAAVEAVLLDLSEADTRLVTGKAEGGEEFFEVAHESLIRGWSKLRSWIEADRAALLTQRRLTEAANQWNENGRDTSYLYQGARLAAAEEWAAAHVEDVTTLESEFIRAASRRQARWKRVKFFGSFLVLVLFVVMPLGWLAFRALTIEQRNTTLAAALVRQLREADISQVPEFVQQLNAYRPWANPLLRQEDAKAASGSSQKLNLDLALLPVDGTKLDELRDQLPLLASQLVVSTGKFSVVRDALLPYRARIVEPFWNVALDSKRYPQQRFQAGCALATYAPNDPRWSQINTFMAGHLVTLEASALVAWREALRPAKAQLIEPLASIYRNTEQEKQPRIYATETLAEYAADRPDELFKLLADAELFQFAKMFDKLAAHKDKAVALAQDELAKRSPEKELLVKRQANAAVALLRLGTPERVWPILKQSPDPRARSYIINWLSPLGGDPQMIVQRFDAELDVTIRRALVLTLGEFTEAQLPPGGRQPLIEKLLVVFETEPDAGLHGAAEWLLRKWGQGKRLEAVLEKLKSDEKQSQAQKSTDKRQWYVNTQQQAFVIVDATGPHGEFLMGSPLFEPGRYSDESLHRSRIGRRFAIAAHEVTKQEFDQFQRGRSDVAKMDTGDRVKTDDSPQVAMTWYEAAHYCNWLSEQEGIAKEQWCYEPNKQGEFAAGMRAKDKFWELTGYRLPTEAEWEYACRAGSITSRYYGLTEPLLGQYAWYQANSQNRAWQVGGLKPNDLGLFDMLGNALEWCFDAYGPYPTTGNNVVEDMPTTQAVQDSDRRVLRGGAFYNRLLDVRSAYRNVNAPALRSNGLGFRPARTYP
jgi:formylglycine-generating enzyme required for sulfatase activity